MLRCWPRMLIWRMAGAAGWGRHWSGTNTHTLFKEVRTESSTVNPMVSPNTYGPTFFSNIQMQRETNCMDPKIPAALSNVENGASLTKEQIMHLLSCPPVSAENYALMAAARKLSGSVCNGKAEVHAQFAVNVAPCSCGCLFCSFAAVNNVFKKSTRITVEEAIRCACQFEADGANAVFIMATAHFPMGDYFEVAAEVRRNLLQSTILIANVGDQDSATAKKLAESGFSGVYHAVRLREGIDTNIDPRQRVASIANFKEAGLHVGTCVEPVGPEHTNEELADAIMLAASFNPVYSGAARRIAIPGTEMAKRGMISELRMAQIVAVTRLATPRATIGNCTHEPCTLGALAGANLFWAEAGANPRDIEEKTEEGRGDTVADCANIFKEADWDVLHGPSRFYSAT